MEAPNDPYQQPDAAATTDPGAFQGEEFTLLDVKNGQQPATASLGFPSNLTDGFGAPVTPVSAASSKIVQTATLNLLGP